MNSNSPNVAPPTTESPLAADAECDERGFLRAEEERVKAALGHSVDELKDSLKQAASLETWARTYPWAALGVAIAGGFTLATIVTPKKGESVGEKLAALTPASAAKDGAEHAEKAAKKSAFISLLLSALFELAKNFAVTRFKAAIQSPTRAKPEPDVQGEPAGVEFPQA